MTVFRTMCPMNCHPTLCGMLVDVADGRVTGVRGDPDNPDSQGFLCIRGQASREILGNPKRLLHPLIRVARGQAAGAASRRKPPKAASSASAHRPVGSSRSSSYSTRYRPTPGWPSSSCSTCRRTFAA